MQLYAFSKFSSKAVLLIYLNLISSGSDVHKGDQQTVLFVDRFGSCVAILFSG
jgi:hypothetical protein